MLIFLDISGCLRRADDPADHLRRECLYNFGATLNGGRNLSLIPRQVVVTGPWCQRFTLTQTREHLPPWIRRFVTATLGERPDSTTRYEAIRSHLASRTSPQEPDGTRGKWLAIDSDPKQFPPDLKNVVFVDPSRGFDHLSSVALGRATNELFDDYFRALAIAFLVDRRYL